MSVSGCCFGVRVSCRGRGVGVWCRGLCVGVWCRGRGWRGPSAAGSTFRACRATATVPRACVGMAGTRREPGGVGQRQVAW